MFLQDPTIKQLMSLESLIQYFFESTKIASDLSEYFFQTKGKGLVFIFDGYDEMSEEDRNNSLVAKIINRNTLPECDLVITSRPSASLSLRDVADCRVEVLGFTEEDRLDYIQHALKGSADKIKALQFYLQSNSTINALCYVPLNMTILLCLFEEVECLSHSTLDLDNKKDIGLPNTQTEMYEKFILMTITRFTKKSNKSFSGKCLTFSDLPEPYNEAFNELLHLAYNALTKDQIVFSLNDEILQACPILKSGKYGGLGLLKVTEYVSNVSFHFLHFSIQESLAAYYIASQSSSFQVQLLRDTFWDIHYFNTWIMYVGMTGGKKIAWKHFISGNRFMLSTKVFKSSKISKRYLNDKIKSLHLFQCFAEIGNKELVGKVFKDKIIDLSNQTLLPRDINTICFFLLRSVNKYWIKLDLSNCNIGDTGSDILCKTFLDKSRDTVSIDKVDLSHNQLQNHSILGLLDVFKVWHASEVAIYGSRDNDSSLFELCLNKFSLYDDEDFSQAILIGPFIFAHNVDIHSQIINSTNSTTGLYLNHCNYPSTDFKYEELSHNLNLLKLHIIGENVGCYFIVTLVQTMKEVDSVYIYDHTLSDEDVKYISFMLSKINSNNLGIWVVIGRTKILGSIPDMFMLKKQFSPIEMCNLGESIKRLCSSSSMSTTKFNKYIRFEIKSVFEDFFYLLHEKNSKCEIEFCLLESYLLIANGVKYGKISKLLSSDLIGIFIAKCKLNATELIDLIGNQSLEKLYIFDSSLDIHSFKYENLLNETLRLKELFIHNTDSSCTLTFDLLEAKTCYPNISILLITNNTLIGHNPTYEQILLSLQLEAHLTVWRIDNFPINIELFQKIANTLSNVVELDIIGCNLEEHEFQQCNNQSNDGQHSDYRISKQSIDNIGKVLSYFTKLKTLNLCHNELREAGAGKLFKYLSILNLNKLNISYNEIDKQAVDDIAKLLAQIFILEELDLSYNNLQVTEVVTLLSEVQNISSCTKLNVSHNSINDEAAHNLATFLSHNLQLKELNLSHGNLQTSDAIAVCKGMSNLLHLTKLDISNNDISGEATDDIVVVLSQNNLIELDLSYNNLGAFSSLHIFRNMKKLSTLIKLNVCGIGLSKITADDIVNVLNNNNKLQELDLSHNNIQETGATAIFKMASTKNLHKLIISHNNINDNVEFLETFLSRNTNLEELDFSHNNLQPAGAIKVCRANLSKLIKFNISHNGITIDAVDDIGALLSHNTKLQKLDLSGNDLQELGYKRIFKSLQIISNLLLLKVSYSSVVNEAADQLATLLLHNIFLRELDLRYNNLSTSDAVKIFSGLKNISNLVTIDISHNMITDEAAEIIATVLSCNNKLQSLDLSCNHFTSEGFVNIFEHLKNIVYLKKLYIGSNEITIKAAHSIATVLCLNSKLEELDLSNNILQTPGTIIIFKSLRRYLNLKKIYINDNMITDEAADDIAVVLSQSTQLEELDISCNDLQTEGIIKIFEGIKHISTLTKLNIAHNMITDEAGKYILDVLSSNSKLKELNLSHINFENASYFKNLKLANLNKFIFSSNNIHEQNTNEISHFLSHCTNLQVLELSDTNLQGTDDIEALNGLDIFYLTKFDISGNTIPTYAANNIAVLLSKNNELKELNLSCNKLKELGVRNILNSINISNLSSLNISNNHITHLKYIAGILIHATKLVGLDLSYNELSAEGMRYFLYQMRSIFANLVKLNVSGNVISDEIAKAFADVLFENTKLKELDLSDNNLHTEGISKIFNGMKISTLIKLSVSHNNITDQAADYMVTFLSRNKKLEELDFSQNNLLSAGAIKICRTTLSKLTAFNISHNGITTRAASDIATFLSRNTKLQKLDVSHNSLLSTGVIMICKANLSKLTTLNISHNGVTVEAADDIAVFLSHNTKLQVLNLSHSDLQASGCVIVFEVLQNISVLTSLEISDCNVIKEAVDQLAIVLYNNISLQELDLSYNNLSKSNSATILKGMKNISNLITLNISHNNINDEAADELGKVLHHNTSLQLLDINCDNLLTSDAIKIFNAMKNVSNLVAMNISHNVITNTSVDNLVFLLICNTSLKEIDLSSNHISTSDAIKIFKGLENISSLEMINISHNMITDEAAENIATVLSHNNKLKSLDLSSNYFRSEGFVKIFDGMKNIAYLKELSIGSNEITTLKAIDCITTFLFHNLELEELDLSNSFMQTGDVIKIFKSLRNISNLRKMYIHGNVITDEAADDIAVVLSQNTKLKEINISCNNLQTAGAVKIFQSIMHISTLTKFNIAHNMITNEATEYIVSIVSNNNKLKELNLSHNNIVISDLTKCNFTNLQELDLSYTDLQTVLSIKDLEVATLQKCNISGNYIPTSVVNDIACFLSESDELQELNLSCNDLQGVGVTSILEFLNISNLTKLNISNNNITSDLNYIVNVLTHATKLAQLDLSYNKLSSVKIEYVLCKAKSLFVNIRNLNLSGNEICNGAANALVSALSENIKLKELSLCDTNLQMEKIHKIFGTLRFPYLTKLSISHNSITEEAADGIATFLSESNGLEELDLSHNYLKSAGITKICRINLLKLTAFNVSHNGITTEAANDIATFLSHNLKLQALDISCNDLLEFGCRNIFTALKNTMALFALKLTNCHVINEAADELAAILLHSILLHELDLSYNNLSTSDAVKIFKGMKNISNLITVDISHNMITDEAAEIIATVLSCNNKLQSLDLSYNYFTSEGFVNIFERLKSVVYLRKLNISSNEITIKAAHSIATVLCLNSKLEELDLSNNIMQTPGTIIIFKSLRRFTNLRKIYISNNMITDEAADDIAVVLSQNFKLEELDFSHNNMLSAGAIKICRTPLSKLTAFNISHNGITTKAANNIATFLSRNTKLQKLDLSHNSLLSAGVIMICKTNLSKLITLNISHNGITVEAADDIAVFLSHNTKLQVLDLSHSNLQETGCVIVFEVLQNVSILTSLKISDCNVIKEAVDELAIVLHNNISLQEFDLSYNNLSKSNSATILKGMKNISNLITLNISHNNITDEAADELGNVLHHSTSLQVLNINCGNLLTLDAIKIFKTMKNISNLVAMNISHNVITNTAVDNLVCLLLCNASLKEIDLSSNHISTSDAIKIFKGMENISSLEMIKVSHNMITDEAAENIATVLSHNSKLKSLDLSSNYFKSESFVKIFDGMKNIAYLKKLSIGSNEITTLKAIDCITTFLFHNLELEELDLSNSFMQTGGVIKIFKSLRSISNLKKMYIHGNVITDEAADDIAVVLSQNTKLKEINISYNNLQTAGAVKIFQSIMHISTLTKFNIAHNMITNEATEYIVSIVSNNNKLKELNLSHNNIVISDLTKCNFTNLQELDLSYTDLQTVLSIKDLEVATLQKCNISGNYIPTSVVNDIACFLSESDELQELNLSCNDLQGVGVTSILEFLSISNLTKLNISNNNITSDLNNIVNVLTQATKLAQLDLSYNKLSSVKIEYVLCKAKSLFVNIRNLNLSGNEICNGAANALVSALSENIKLKELSLCDTNLQMEEINKIFGTLRFPYLTKLSISHNSITEEAADGIATFLSESNGLEELDLSHNYLKSAGITKICRINLLKLTAFNVSHNGITTEAANDIATFLSHNLKLQALDISCNDLLEVGCRNIFTALKNTMALSELKLTNCHVINEAADKLAAILLHSILLHELDLSYNNLSTSDAVKIFKGMKNILNLITVDISHNMITDEAAEIIATVLSCNNKLQSLDLSYNYFTSEGFVNIFERLKSVIYLRKLNISSNEITIKAAHSIATVLYLNSKLEELDLSNNIMQTPGTIVIFKSLRHLTNLKKIYISDNMITDEAAENIATVLSHNSKLKSLDLSSNYFRSEGFVKIFDGMKNITYLKKLSIGSNEITTLKAIDCITTFLFHNLELEELDLSNSFMQTGGVIKIFKSLRNISNLRKMYIHGNVITDEAADDIAVVLSQNTKLKEINISYNNLQTAGAVKIFHSIMHISTLTKFNIAHNMITNEATEYIVSILSNNNKLKELNLSHNNIVISDLTKCNFTNLQELDLSYTDLQTVLSIKDLEVATLQKCNISGNYIPTSVVNDIACFLSESDELQELNLSCNDLQGVGVTSILEFLSISNLTKLNISNNNITSDLNNIVNVLTQATKLAQLDLSYNKLSSVKIEYVLCKAKSLFVNIRNLNLSGNEICNGAANALVSALSENIKLKELSLCDTNLQMKEINKIFGTLRFPYLTKLSISHNSITEEAADGIATFLSESSGLEELDLSHNYLKSAGITKICRINLLKLTAFNVSHNGITTKAANDIATFLSHNLKLQALDISCNDLLEVGCRNIFTALKNTMVLFALKLTNCHVINEAANELAAILLHSILLHEFDLSYNNISTSDAVKIFKGMKNISNLITVDISHNMITDEAAEIIATVLSCNNKLQSLDLSYNYFTSEGFVSIFERLKSVVYLRKLNISSNEITIKAAHSIATVLCLNSKLEELDLSNNIMQTPGTIIIFKSLRHLTNLRKIYISDNKITDEAADDIAVVLSQNIKLEELDISCNHLQASGTMKICRSNLRNLTSFKISHNCIVASAAIHITTFLSRNANLEKLDLSHNNLQSIGIIKICQMKLSKLTTINISHNGITSEASNDIAVFLSHNTKLQIFDVSCNNFRESGCMNILKVLQHTPVLSSLKISDCNVIKEAADELTNVLLHNTLLQELDLSYNSLSTLDSLRILKGMKNISSLVTLNVSHNKIIDEAADELANVLLYNTKLEKVDLSFNDLSNSDILKIFKGMKNISNLKEINIGYNMITDKAADSIATVLSHNSKLQTLNMTFNYLRSKGCIKIFNGMKNILYLSNLNISHNKITCEATGSIAAILSHSTKLRQLDISYNDLQTSGAIEIFQSIKHTSTLTKFNIAHNMISEKATEDIINILYNNTGRIKFK